MNIAKKFSEHPGKLQLERVDKLALDSLHENVYAYLENLKPWLMCNRLARYIDLMERLNPNSDRKVLLFSSYLMAFSCTLPLKSFLYQFMNLPNWSALLSGKWCLLYHRRRQIGLTICEASPRVLIGNVYLSFLSAKDNKSSFSMVANIDFTVMVGPHWPHDKRGKEGNFHISSNLEMINGERIYQMES